MLSLLVAFSMAAEGAAARSATWIFPPDYPAALVEQRFESRVEFELAFSAEGRLTRCDIVRSSGAPLLDATTCRLALRRARAKQGEPRVQRFQHTWRVPTAG